MTGISSPRSMGSRSSRCRRRSPACPPMPAPPPSRPLPPPVVVTGGGLPAIDTPTEALAYYPLQVEKFLTRFETLAAERGVEAVRADWNAAEREVAEEFIAHARAIRAEREAAAREGRPPRLAQLIEAWGGVTIAYRRRLIDAPSYTLNHEEVAKAMEEGIRFAERLTPVQVQVHVVDQAAAL